MSQHDYVIANQSGSAFRADLNNALAASVSTNSGSAAPSTTYAYMLWADTTNAVLKIRNSANNAWIELLQLDGTLTMEDGSVTAPGLAFRDDLNTGIWSSDADTLQISTGGVERFQVNNISTIFNQTGASVDFRIEGDSQPNLFFLDASTDRIGINTSTPVAKFQVLGGTGEYYTTARGITDNAGISVYGIDINSAEPTNINEFGGAISFGVGGEGRSAIAAKKGDATDDDRTGLSFFTHSSKTATHANEEALILHYGGDLELVDGNFKVASGHGIDFSATADGSGSSIDELLDDYEEGTWSPVVVDGANGTNTGGGAVTASAASGTYTKIGREVTVQYFASWRVYAHASNGVGTLEITGLPFASYNSTAKSPGTIKGKRLATGSQFDGKVNTSIVSFVDDQQSKINYYLHGEIGVWDLLDTPYQDPSSTTSTSYFGIYGTHTYFV